jgi:hypothetical protein
LKIESKGSAPSAMLLRGVTTQLVPLSFDFVVKISSKMSPGKKLGEKNERWMNKRE